MLTSPDDDDATPSPLSLSLSLCLSLSLSYIPFCTADASQVARDSNAQAHDFHVHDAFATLAGKRAAIPLLPFPTGAAIPWSQKRLRCLFSVFLFVYARSGSGGRLADSHLERERAHATSQSQSTSSSSSTSPWSSATEAVGSTETSTSRPLLHGCLYPSPSPLSPPLFYFSLSHASLFSDFFWPATNRNGGKRVCLRLP